MNFMILETAALPIIAALSFVALIIFAVSVVQDGRTEERKPSIIRRGYIYLVSFAALLIVAAAVVDLTNLGLRTWVFTQADQSSIFREPPPALYLTLGDRNAPVEVSTITCTENCPLTDTDRTTIASWKTQYADWQNRQEPSNIRARSLVNALSFLIVGVVVFLIHWRFVRGDMREIDVSKNMTRSAYFSSMSFVMLALIIIFGSFFVNTTLKTFIPAAQEPTTTVQPYPMTSVSSALPECADVCDLDAETVAIAESWDADMEQWSKGSAPTSSQRRHSDFAMQLGFLLVAIPLFAYHFRTVWHERKAQPPTPSA